MDLNRKAARAFAQDRLGSRAPEPELLAKRFDGQRCHSSPCVISWECVPGHHGIMVWSARQRMRTSVKPAHPTPKPKIEWRLDTREQTSVLALSKEMESEGD